MAVIVLLLAGGSSPVYAGAVGLGNVLGLGQNGQGQNNDDQGQNKGSACVAIPADCSAKDCRCEAYGTSCTSCRRFGCPRGTKNYAAAICRPCCVDKYGHTDCKEAPDEDAGKCVPSPS